MGVKNLEYKMPIEIEGLLVKTSMRAKRISMSFDVRVNDVIVTKPKRASKKAVAEFIRNNQSWVADARAKLQTEDKFIEGGKISIYGSEYVIERRDGRGISRIEEDKIIIHAQEHSLSRRLKDFLKKLAIDKIKDHLEEKILKLNLSKLPDFRVVDPKTRWGSCTSDGRLMFSWRLILAPVDVLDYIVAHEASHLKHMDHSPNFWNLCYSLTPDALSAKIWIKRNGTEIMSYR